MAKAKGEAEAKLKMEEDARVASNKKVDDAKAAE